MENKWNEIRGLFEREKNKPTATRKTKFQKKKKRIHLLFAMSSNDIHPFFTFHHYRPHIPNTLPEPDIVYHFS